MSSFTQAHALVIGVGEYRDTKWSAKITAADAQAVTDALKEPAIGAYPPEHVQFLQGAQATCIGVVDALKELAKKAKDTDTVLIFFTGHGALGTDGKYYFATHETVFTEKKIREGTGLSAPDLLVQLRKIRSQKLLFIINACFSGYLAPTLGAPDVLGAPPSVGFNVEVLATGEGRAIITASRPTQYSYYMPDSQHTFFGQALIDGLRGKAANGGGYIGLYELYQHLYTAVKAASAAVQVTQEPMLTIMQGVGPFPVSLYPDSSTGKLGAPIIRQAPPLGTAIEQVPSDIVQAIGSNAQAFNIQNGGGTVSIDQSKLIDFADASISGSINIGRAARGNITEINITSAVDVAKINTKDKLLDLIAKLQAEVAELKELPEGDREDAVENLRRAKEAGDKGDKNRLLRNLESAQKIMTALAGSIPTALKFGEIIGVLIQRAMGM